MLLFVDNLLLYNNVIHYFNYNEHRMFDKTIRPLDTERSFPSLTTLLSRNVLRS